MNVRILRQAQKEVNAAIAWYRDQGSGLGDEFLVELNVAYEFILDHARLVPRVEQYRGPEVVRRQILKRFPYMVVFACRDEELVVVAVSHTRRKPLYWLNRLN